MSEEDENKLPSVPTLDGDSQKALEEWEEFKKYPVYDMMLEGWWPAIRKKRDATYITMRRKYKDGSKISFSEKSLGKYDTARWNALVKLSPHQSPPTRKQEAENDESSITQSGESPLALPPPEPIMPGFKPRTSSVLSAKVGKPRVLESTIHPNLETLQWYYWVQQNAGYPGTFEDFINHAVHDLFTEHYRLELAIVREKEE